MTNLKAINFGLNQYCGPSVMSALTGKSTDECAAVIMGITGKSYVERVQVEHLLKAFKKLRFDSEKVERNGYSLYSNLDRLSDKDGLYIVLVPRHVVAVEIQKGKIYLVDNASKEPLHAESSARLSQKVEQIYKLTPMPEPKFIRNEIHVNRFSANTIHIVAWDVYDTENVSRHLGQFMFKDDKELATIVEKIKETIRYEH